MTDLVGEPLERALLRLAALGVTDVRICLTQPPRGGDRGATRVILVRDGGRELLCARFPDEVSP